MYIEVVPTYGRDYKNQREVKTAWAEGKDFRDTATGSAVNKQDADNLGLSVIVRYAKLQKVVQVRR